MHFLDITSVFVLRSVIGKTHEHLRHMGHHGFEGLAVWAGTREGASFRVSHAIIPEQEPIRTADGVAVVIRSSELHRLNVWLYEQSLSLIAQVHSHPTGAYHSDTDDDFAIATVAGSLSIVVPDFATAPFSMAACAIYRLNARGAWIEVPPSDAARLITIVD